MSSWVQLLLALLAACLQCGVAEVSSHQSQFDEHFEVLYPSTVKHQVSFKGHFTRALTQYRAYRKSMLANINLGYNLKASM